MNLMLKNKKIRLKLKMVRKAKNKGKKAKITWLYDFLFVPLPKINLKN